ncbi:MAG: phasin [Roseiarcus sp.]
MTTSFPTLEVPAEIRNFAASSVAQARQAFAKVIEATNQAIGQAEKSPIPIPANVKELNAKAIGFADANVKAAFDLADKLVQAKDAQEAVSLQTEYLKTQLAALQEQAKEMGAAMMSAVTHKPV